MEQHRYSPNNGRPGRVPCVASNHVAGGIPLTESLFPPPAKKPKRQESIPNNAVL